MGLLSNTLRMGASQAPTAEADPYQIDNSIRFNSADSPVLECSVDAHNPQGMNVHTWSGWVKRNKLGTAQAIFNGGEGSDGHDREGLVFLSDDTLTAYWRSGGTTQEQLITSRRFRDPSAWMHIVWAVDLRVPGTSASGKSKVYINGELLKDWDTTFSASVTKKINALGQSHWLGKTPAGDPSDLQIADVQFIDGLALASEAFGKFTDTGSWDPIAFKIPTPNNGTTWSGGTVTGSNTNSGGGPAQAFDGSISSAHWRTNNGEAQKLTFSSAISVSSSLNFYCKGDGNEPFSYWMDGNEYEVDPTAELGANTEGWVRRIGAGSFQAVEVSSNSSGNRSRIMAIKVDGGMLIDGKTDQTYAQWKTANAINDGRDWGKGAFQKATNGGSLSAWTDPESNGFDGRIAADASPPQEGNIAAVAGANVNNATIKWTVPGPPIQGTNFKLCCYQPQGTAGITNTLSINGATAVADTTYAGVSANDVGWTANIAIPAGGLTSLEMYFAYSGGHSWFGWYAIQVDGVVLLSGFNRNAFHLKFNDAGKNRYLGKDTLNGKISDATGGLPIYKTVAGATDADDYGDVKDGTDIRTDANKANLVFAVSGDSIADISNHADLRNSGSAKTITNSNAVVTTDQSRFYGSSISLGAYNENKSFYVTPANGGTDFDFGTSSFCFECWARSNSTSHNSASISPIFETSYDDTGLTGWIMLSYTANTLRFYYVNAAGNAVQTVDSLTSLNTTDVGKWVHHAVTHDSSTNKLRVFRNGVCWVEKSSGDFKADWTSASGLYIGNQNFSGDSIRYFRGEISDFRVYKGAPVYTASFKPPVRNDFSVTNLDESASNGSVPGTVSSLQTTGAPFHASYPASNAFDSNTGTIAGHGYNSTQNQLHYVPSSQHTSVTSFRIHKDFVAGQCEIRLKADNTWGSWFNTPASNNSAWIDITSEVSGGKVNGFDIRMKSGISNGIYIAAIEVNGSYVTQATYSGSVSSPAGLDVLVDSPTNYTPESGDDKDGAVTRGNYATLSPLENGGLTVLQGNLAFTDQTSAGWDTCKSSMYMSSGKWYMEMTIGTWNGSGAPFLIGVADNTMAVTGVELGQNQNSWCFLPTGQKRHNSSTSSHGSAWSSGKIIGIALDLSGGLGSGKMWVSIDGTWQASGNPATGANAAFTDIGDTGEVTFAVANAGGNTSDQYHVNYGQRAFNTAAPTGFSCLCTQNLDDLFGANSNSAGDKNNPAKYFGLKTWTGNDTDDTDIRGFKFQPEMVWLKRRGAVGIHGLWDAIRGTNVLDPSADATDTAYGTPPIGGYISQFNSDGFRLKNGSTNNTYTNVDSGAYIAWAWDAGTTAATASTDGTITPSAQWVNTTAGFSISAYTGTGSAGTIGHGLGAKPELIMIKSRDAQSNNQSWTVHHKDVAATNNLILNDTAAAGASGSWNNTAPTDTVFSVGTVEVVNTNTKDYIAYCWTSKEGYSAFGSYTASSDLPFIYTGFKIAFLMIKNVSSGSTNWRIMDSERDPFNDGAGAKWIKVTSAAEIDERAVDILSNGFKLRMTDGGDLNYSTDTFIYCAFASSPFKTARAR